MEDLDRMLKRRQQLEPLIEQIYNHVFVGEDGRASKEIGSVFMCDEDFAYVITKLMNTVVHPPLNPKYRPTFTDFTRVIGLLERIKHDFQRQGQAYIEREVTVVSSGDSV